MTQALPTPTIWRGAPRWACPFCQFDSAAYADVQGHLHARHFGRTVGPVIEPELSCVAVPVPKGVYPKISCVMVTKDRPTFVAESLRYYQAQTYPNKELIVVADGCDLTHIVEEVNDQSITLEILRASSVTTIGTKRNMGCQLATAEFIANWDDDEWQSPNRLFEQYKSLVLGALISGIAQPIFMMLDTRELFWFSAKPSKGYCSGSSMMFRRSLWQKVKFPNVQVGEDVQFLSNIDASGLVHVSPGLNVSFVHSGNTVTKRVTMHPYVKLTQTFHPSVRLV